MLHVTPCQATSTCWWLAILLCHGIDDGQNIWGPGKALHNEGGPLKGVIQALTDARSKLYQAGVLLLHILAELVGCLQGLEKPAAWFTSFQQGWLMLWQMCNAECTWQEFCCCLFWHSLLGTFEDGCKQESQTHSTSQSLLGRSNHAVPEEVMSGRTVLLWHTPCVLTVRSSLHTIWLQLQLKPKQY